MIGRLLYDSESILADQLEALQQSNRKNDDGTIDLAILTDGLKAEREQGITIDVAYKYFQTEKGSLSLLIPLAIFNIPGIWLQVLQILI